MVQSALEPGEQIVWIGQPRMGLLVITAGLMTAICIFMSLVVFNFLPDFGELRWVILYATLVCYVAMPGALLAFQWRRWRNTAYVLTSHRAIAFVPHWRLGYRVYVNLPEDLGSSRCVTIFGCLGSIVWAEGPNQGYLAGAYRGAFATIDNAKDVERLMHETFLPHLVQGLKSTSPEVRRKSIVSLGRIGRVAKEAIPYLIDALASEDSFIRRHAAEALGRIGNAAKPAVPQLQRMFLTDENRITAESARRATQRIATPS
jgi:hypothetical protein